ncbi:MAG: hypothetical protein QM605_13455 [Sphingobium sp.]
MSDLERRRLATETTRAKYEGMALDFRTADCARMIRYHLIQMGHRPPALPRYRSLTGAARALKETGGIIATLDTFLPRIAPARMLLGDVAVGAGEGGEAGWICLGYKFMGWHQDSATPVAMSIDLSHVTAAWRV